MGQDTTGEVLQGQGVESILSELKKEEKKQTVMTAITMCSVMGMFVIFLVCALILVPRAVSTVRRLETTADAAEALVEKANDSLSKIDTMSESLVKSSDSLNTLINDNMEELSTAMDSISKVDFEGLNSAITDLQNATESMIRILTPFH